MKLKEGLIIREIDDEYILVDTGKVPPRFNGMVKLNETAKYIVDLLMENDLSIKDIVDNINNNFDVSGIDVNDSVSKIIKELENAKLLKLT